MREREGGERETGMCRCGRVDVCIWEWVKGSVLSAETAREGVWMERVVDWRPDGQVCVQGPPVSILTFPSHHAVAQRLALLSVLRAAA